MKSPVIPDHGAGTEARGSGPDAGQPASTAPVRPEASPHPASSSPSLRVPSREPRARHRDAPEVRLQLKLVRLSDTIVVVSVLLLVFIATNVGRMPEGLAEFLALRVTVKNLAMLALFALAWRLLCRATGLYHWQSIRKRRAESARVVVTSGLVSAVALVFPTVSVTGAFSYEAVLYFWLGSSAAILVFRNLVRAIFPVPEPGRLRDALIVGTGPRAQRLARELQTAVLAEYHVVGFVDCTDHCPPAGRPAAFLGSLDQVENILMDSAVDEVLITLPIKSHYAEIQAVLETCERVGVAARYLADLFDPIKGRSSHEGDRPSLVLMPPAPQGWPLVIKRMIDLVGAAGGLIVISPVLLVAAAAIKLTGPGPVFFTQERYGLNRRRFRMYKLRTMVDQAEALQSTLESRNEASGPVFKIREDPRITRVGRILRRTSLDELPQLVNVLRGQMSLVGPRPLPIRDVHRFAEAAMMRRFSIRPGVTCLWQIGGRGNVGFDDWIKLDLQYIDEWSIPLDLIILLKTIPAVLRGTGAS